MWTYDRNGNRLSEKAGAAAVSTYTYDAADQLTAITGTGAKVFTNNAHGDQITSGADVSTFNGARQTTCSTVGGVTTTFAYDGNGNRHTITTAGVATSELWDTVGGLPNLALERNSAGVVQRRYSYGRGTETLGYTDPVAATQGWYLTDAMGSVANITNSTGVSVATYTYNPFGVARVNTMSPGYTANPLKYTGQHQDPTGNYNLRARQYNPAIGRFTQTDAMPYGAGTAFESSYVYGMNSPPLYTDPSGLRGVNSSSGWKYFFGNQVKGVFSSGQMIFDVANGGAMPGTMSYATDPSPQPCSGVMECAAYSGTRDVAGVMAVVGIAVIEVEVSLFTATRAASGQAPLRFTAAQTPLENDVANRLDRTFPGRMIAQGKKLWRPDGSTLSDMDIWGDNFVVEVTSTSQGKTTQVLNIARASGKRMAVYGPNLKGSAVKGIETNGIPVFEDLPYLEAWIAQR